MSAVSALLDDPVPPMIIAVGIAVVIVTQWRLALQAVCAVAIALLILGVLFILQVYSRG